MVPSIEDLDESYIDTYWSRPTTTSVPSITDLDESYIDTTWSRPTTTSVSQDPFNIPAEDANIERTPARGWQKFHARTVKEAVQCIIPYLEDRSEPNQVIYFDGWRGLCASAVLTSIAKDPPSSLSNKFDKIIHIDCSRWKSRRALQRTIAQKLSLPQHVMDIFNGQDDEDDFTGIHEDSRIEIAEAGREIHQALQGQSCLVLFHNGSNKTINLNDFGIPQPADRWSNFVLKVLWTFRGRLHAMKEATYEQRVVLSSVESKLSSERDQPKGKVDNSHIYLYSYLDDSERESWNELVREEATEISHYTRKLVVTSETAALCCKYMLLLNSKGVDTLDYNWATHASNYWVCDGIIQEHQQDQAWEAATALHEEMRLEDFSSHRLPYFDDTTRWIVATNSTIEEIKPGTTSFFWANKSRPVDSLTNNKVFQKAEQLHVLKLCSCTFSFSSPPFLHCQNIRFLGLDNCKDQGKILEENKDEEEKDRQKIEFFQSLYVLDISHTDWELNLSPDIMERMAMNMREISIKQGRIWHVTHAWTWKHLQNVHKLRVIEPTCPWETGSKDQFTGMVKLELLDLSGNDTMQVLLSLSSAISLSNLVLDGVNGLKHVIPGTLPPSLETFSFDAGSAKGHKEAKISRISLADCTRLVNFRLRGSLMNLEELDLSNTSIKSLDLRDQIVQVPCLQHVIMMGCEQLCAVVWPKMPKLNLLLVDTRGGQVATSLVCEKQGQYCHARVSVTDMRFIQSLVVRGGLFLINDRFNLNLFLSCGKDAGGTYNSDKTSPYSTEQLVGSPSPLNRSWIPRTYGIYSDVNVNDATTDLGVRWALHFQPKPLDIYIEIGEGISHSVVTTEKAMQAVRYVMDKAESLFVHDNSCISTVNAPMPEGEYDIDWNCLQRCRVERCSKLETVFTTNCAAIHFGSLNTFWAVDLLMACSIWSKRTSSRHFEGTFGELHAVHIRFCPRLAFVLPLPWLSKSCLEILQIICCGDLTEVFPAEAEFLNRISTVSPGGVLAFADLKHIYLYELPKLHQISEAKIYAPIIETVTVRGCWSLKRIPATSDRPKNRPVVDCEKDWWEKLEWDGKEADHHPSLFETRHSKYYKETLLRSSVLR